VALHHHNRAVDPGLIELLTTPEIVRMRDKSGRSPLHILCRYSYRRQVLDVEAVRLLVDLYPENLRDVDVNNDGRIPFHEACLVATRESMPAMRYMIERFPESIMTLTDKGETGLHIALGNTRFYGEEVIDTVPIVELFAEVSPEAFNVACTVYGFIPLHVACMSYADDQYDLVRNLVEAFPEGLNRLDNYGRTPLHVLCMHTCGVNDLVKTIEYMLSKNPELLRLSDNAGHTPLHLAVKGRADDEFIRHLAYKCPEVMEPPNEGRPDTPLHLACDQSDPRLSIIEFLLSFSERAATAKNAKGQTPLHLLSANGAPRDCLMALLESSPGLAQESDNNGRIALRTAIDGMRLKYERLSEDRDMYDVFDMNEEYRNAQNRVRRYDDTIRCLLEAFPEGVSMVDNDGMSPLMAAAEADLSLDFIFELVSADPIACLGLLR
jgi:ankyrin repeat protein